MWFSNPGMYGRRTLYGVSKRSLHIPWWEPPEAVFCEKSSWDGSDGGPNPNEMIMTL